jgi:hypothetical protein
MRETLNRLAAMRQILLGMEVGLGIDSLGEPEALVLYAAAQSQKECKEISITAIQAHPLTQKIPRSTFFRAIGTLIERGLLVKAGPEKRSGYLLCMKD